MFQNSAFPRPLNLPTAWPRPAALGRRLETLPWPRTWQGYLQWLLAMLLLAGPAALQIRASIHVAQARKALYTLQVEQERIRHRNAELLWQLSRQTDLDQVYARATEWGLRLPAALPLAPTDESTRPVVMAPTPQTPASADVADEQTGWATPVVDWWHAHWPVWQSTARAWLDRLKLPSLSLPSLNLGSW